MRPGVPDRVVAVVSGDFDADGDVDFLAANFEAGSVSFFQQEPSGDYVERSPSPLIVLEGPVFMTTADLNGDQREDAVIVNRLGRGISIRLSDPELTFRATVNLLIGRSPQAVAVADFNGDKRLDLAITSQSQDLVYIYYGKGDGNFTFARTIDVRTTAQKSAQITAGPYGIVAGDFDANGRIDLAVSQYDTDQIALLRGNGNGTFQSPTTVFVGRHPTYLLTARLNDDQSPGPSDDFPDLVVLLEGGRQNPANSAEIPDPGGVSVLLGNGNGTFTAGVSLPAALGTCPSGPNALQSCFSDVDCPQSSCVGADQPAQLAVGKLRLGATGFDDLVVADFGTNHLSLYPADGLGGFGSGTLLGSSGSTLRNPSGVALLDRDADGAIDRIVAANYGSFSFTVFDGGGLTPFTEVPFSPITSTRQPVAMAFGSLDQAGGDDLAVLSGADPSVKVFSTLDDGFFFPQTATPLPAGSNPTALALSDFDHDSHLDGLVALSDADGAAGPSTSPAVVVLKGDGFGSLGSALGLCAGGSRAGASCASDPFCPGGTCAFSPTFGTCVAGTNSGLACAGDADCPSSTCTLPPAPIALSAPATTLLSLEINPTDADRDGVPDLSDNCPARYNPLQENTRGLSCLGGPNEGQPCSGDPDCPGGTCSVPDLRGDACDGATADPDGDGVMDLSDNCPDSYNPGQIDTDGNRVGDRCDHDFDLVALEGSANQIEVFMAQMGGGGYLPPILLTTGVGPAGLAHGDFTAGDFNPDLVVTNPASGSFQVFAGDGRGGFSALPPIPLAGASSTRIAVLEANAKDLDLDGVPNLLDNCPTRYNPGQEDDDNDGAGNVCSSDPVFNPDGDFVVALQASRADNCPDTYNSTQTDTDGDKIGDACDSNPSIYNPADDQDLDGVANSIDNCPTRYNPNQEDSNLDGVGNACDEQSDPDLDGVLTATRIRDNCPDTYNPGQEDLNFDGIGDACENVLDLAILNPAADEVLLVLQSPPGTWLTPSSIAVGGQPGGIAAADLNSDGASELVVTNSADSTVNVLLGTGTGAFLTDPEFYTVPVFPSPGDIQPGFFTLDPNLDFPEMAVLSQPLGGFFTLANIIHERADIDDSGRVDGKDLAVWAKGFGLSRANSAYAGSKKADINQDGVIDGLDLVFIVTHFGKTIPASSP